MSDAPETPPVLSFGCVRVHLGDRSGKYPDGNQVIVQGREERVAFDTPRVALRIGQDLLSVDCVILGHVHEDHIVALHALPQAKVQVPEADLAAVQSWEGLSRHYGYPPDVLADVRQMIERDFSYQSRPDATAYVHDQVWDLGGGVTVRAHHLPGHTAGHSALVVENEGVAFIGDIDLTGFGPYYGDATSDLAAFRRSLREVRALDARVWVTSHHRGVVTDRQAFLQALDRFSAKLEERSDKLIGYLRDGPQTLDELVARRLLYPAGFVLPYVDCAERRSIALHLLELQEEGVVQRHPDDRYALRS